MQDDRHCKSCGHLLAMHDTETVMVIKAIKAVPASKVTVCSYPGQAAVGGYYLRKNCKVLPSEFLTLDINFSNFIE